MEKDKRSTTVNSLERGLKLLGLIAESEKAVSISEMSRQTGLAKGSISRIVSTLTQTHFISRDPATARYRGGTRLLELAHKSLAYRNIIEVARPIMESINIKTQEAVHISILNDDGQMIFLDKIEAMHALRPFVQLGSYNPAYCGASGKAVLSTMSPETVKRILPSTLTRFTETTIIDSEELMLHLKEIKIRGYAINRGEYRPDISGVAAPIFDYTSKAVASIGVVVATSRMSNELERKLGEIIAISANDLSRTLGYGG